MELIKPDQAEYNDARRIWNGAIDRRPAAIARVANAGEIAGLLRQVRATGRSITVRGAGHSAPGHSIADDALLIDLCRMRSVQVDAERRVARVGGGCLWSHVDTATAAHGLATTGGLVSHTGVGGLTLGGGIGWLMRKHGLTIDNLLSAEVVLADGTLVRACESENADLFWALRGGGGNFGVVTEFEFRLHPVRTVIAGMVLYPASRANAMLRFYREFAATAPDELTTVFAFLTAPPAPFIPAQLQGSPVVAIVACWTGDLERGAAVLRPLRAYGPPAHDLLGEMPYVALQSMLDAGAASGRHYHMKSANFGDLSDTAIDDIVAGAARMTSPLSQVHLHHLGGAVSRVAADATAYANRNAAYILNLIPSWSDPAETASHVDWARAVFDRAVAHSNGSVYVNFLGDEGQSRVKAAFGADKYLRLARIKRRYDPDNVFRHNQNIRPE
ncbi:MAG TPA: FAD-binding oxidoreductase [Steroidobacteraceae bacterium]|nr:FAD-binding oxidoreductase [Steroidobacteraceae bacterium]